MKKPDEYRGFYWAPDYSFCGFAPNAKIEKTAKQWVSNEKIKVGERLAYIKGKTSFEKDV